MKVYLSILAFLFLPCFAWAEQTAFSDIPIQGAEIAFGMDDSCTSIKQKKSSWKTRFLQKVITKKLRRLQRKKNFAKGGEKPINDMNWLSFGAAIASWLTIIIGVASLYFLALSVAAIVLGVFGVMESGGGQDYGGEGLGIAGLAIGAFNLLAMLVIIVVLLSAFY